MTKMVVFLLLVSCFTLIMGSAVFASEAEAVLYSRVFQICPAEKMEYIIAREEQRVREFGDDTGVIVYDEFGNRCYDNGSGGLLQRLADAYANGDPVFARTFFFVPVIPDLDNKRMYELDLNTELLIPIYSDGEGKMVVHESNADTVEYIGLEPQHVVFSCPHVQLTGLWFREGVTWMFDTRVNYTINVSNISLNLFCDRNRSLDSWRGSNQMRPGTWFYRNLFAPPSSVWAFSSATLTSPSGRWPLVWT